MATGNSSCVTYLSLNEILKAVEHHNLHLSSEEISFLCAEIISLEKEKILAKKIHGSKNVKNNSIDPSKFVVDFCEKYEIVLDLEDIVPKPKTLWPSFHGKRYFSTVKLNYGAYGSLLLEETKAYTAGFKWEGQPLIFKKVIPGMYLSQYGFQKQMEKMFHDMVPEKVVVYLDVVYVFGETEDELFMNASQVITQLSEKCKMPLDNAECTLFQKSVELLGYRVSKGKLKIPPSILEIIENIERPVTIIELFDFMAVVGFYKEMIKGFARLAAPLTELLGTPRSVVKNVNWQQQHQISFEVVKKKLLMKPTLAICDEKAEKILYVTSSKVAIEGDLYQIDLKTNEKEAIGYFSAKVESNMKNWEAFDLEMLAIAESCQYFQPYLKNSFTVYTANTPRMYKERFKSPSAQLKKLRSKIGDFSFKVRRAIFTDAGFLVKVNSMIPSLPETISGTHVEYFPLSAAVLASAFINSYSSYYRMGASDGNSLLRVSDLNGEEPCKEPSTKSLPLAPAFSHYFRGCDLHYAPHTHVPAAQSVQNCPMSDTADAKTFGASN